MATSSENSLQLEIAEYKEQIKQIDAAISACSDSSKDELLALKADLENLLKLTEGNLLELKKQILLNQLDSIESGHSSNSDVIEIKKEKPIKKSESTDIDDIDLSDIAGSKCRVYFDCNHTNLKMHNAIVMGVDSYENNTVRVVFCNPTQKNMKVCENFLNDNCKFQEKCKFSHGYSVKVEDLEAFESPSYDHIKVGISCLAKHTDNLWHLGRVESFDEHNICVQFKKFNLVCALEWESVYLLDSSDISEDDDDDDDDDSDSSDSDSSISEDDNNISYSYSNSFTDNNNKTKPQTSQTIDRINLGEWEKHTRGIGSKLMSKMGYEFGKGLGKNSEGRLEPVEVTVLPDGKISLDKAMELKEKNLLKNRRKKIKKLKKIQQVQEVKEEVSVFDFINNKLKLQKEPSNEQTQSKEKQAARTSKSIKDLDIQIFETHNKIQTLEKTVLKIEESLTRNKNADKDTVNKIKSKLQEAQNQLNKLKREEATISKEKKNLKGNEKLF